MASPHQFDDDYHSPAPSIQDQLHDLATFAFPAPPNPDDDPSGRAAFNAVCSHVDAETRQTYLRFPRDSVLDRLERDAERVSLRHCGLGDRGIVALGEALRVNQSIHSLDLADNGVTHTGLASLLGALDKAKNVTTLDLSNNRLSRGCVISLSTDMPSVQAEIQQQQQRQQAIMQALAAAAAKENGSNSARKKKASSARQQQDQQQQSSARSARSARSATGGAQAGGGAASSSAAGASAAPTAAAEAAGSDAAAGAGAGGGVAASTSAAVPPPTNVPSLATGYQQSSTSIFSNHSPNCAGATLGRFLAKNVSLQALSLKANKLNDTDCIALAEGMSENRTLLSLDLSHNDLGPGSKDALAAICNTDLRELNLEWNKLQNADAVTVIEQFTSQSLEKVLMGFNGLGDDAAAALGNVLSGSSVLRYIDVSNNHIGPRGAQALGPGIARSQCLQVLVMNTNPLQDDGVSALLRGIADNQTLKNVDLRQTGAGPLSAEMLPQLLQSKPDDFVLDWDRTANEDE